MPQVGLRTLQKLKTQPTCKIFAQHSSRQEEDPSKEGKQLVTKPNIWSYDDKTVTSTSSRGGDRLLTISFTKLDKKKHKYSF